MILSIPHTPYTKSQQCEQPFPWYTLGLTLLPLLLYWLLGPAPEALVYERSAIATGEWWRLVTAHWVHSDLQHLIFDVAALGIASYLVERIKGWYLLLPLALSTITIDAWIWWQMPWLEAYCGLSGILNAVIAYGLLVAWKEQNDPLYLLVGALLTGKIVTELFLGEALFTHTAWAAVPEAHAVGIAAGLLMAIGSKQTNTIDIIPE